MKNATIGILGGMGTYATIHVFQQYAQIFEAEKEWDRPRLVIDNRCTMPSRVRAILYNEKQEVLVEQMIESLRLLKNAGAEYIILACNTSHVFLPQIYQRDPSLQENVVDIIDSTIDYILSRGMKKVSLLASEGTIESKIYQDRLKSKGIECVEPRKANFNYLRDCIEAVKQNNYSDDLLNVVTELFMESEPIILGCTELPILYDRYRPYLEGIHVLDPVEIALKRIKRELE